MHNAAATFIFFNSCVHYSLYMYSSDLEVSKIQLSFYFPGGNRRSQGRRGGSTVTAPRSAGPVKFEGEFDFESSNAKFNKEEIEEELQQKLHENLRITNEVKVNLLFLFCSYMYHLGTEFSVIFLVIVFLD